MLEMVRDKSQGVALGWVMDKTLTPKGVSNSPFVSEWMQHLFKFLKELLSKLNEYYSINNQLNNQSSNAANYDVATLLKQWTYCTQLGRYMYEVRFLATCTGIVDSDVSGALL